MREWTKTPYGKTQEADGSWSHDGGHWTISNGQLSFDVHVQYLMSREGTQEIVSPEQAEEYANKIIDALNAAEVDVQ